MEMDQFNLEMESELTPEAVGARPGNILVPVSNIHSLSSGERARSREAGAPGRGRLACPLVAPVGLRRIRAGRRAAFWKHRAALFSQALSMAEKRGKSSGSRWSPPTIFGKASCAPAASLQSSTIVLGHSAKDTTEEQARQIGDAWEKLGDPKPQFNLEIHLPNGDKVYKVLGPHAPNLTANEVNLLHRLWLRFSDVDRPAGVAPSRCGALRARRSAERNRGRSRREALIAAARTPRSQPEEETATNLRARKSLRLRQAFLKRRGAPFDLISEEDARA